LQEEIIKAILDKKDVFVLMSRDGGKSLCYRWSLLLVERSAWGVERFRAAPYNSFEKK